LSPSGKNAYEKLLRGGPLEFADLKRALNHAGGFTLSQCKGSQSHYKVRRENVERMVPIAVRHDGTVLAAYVDNLLKHFCLGDEGDKQGEEDEQ
jgi:hypothetical protein